MVLAKQNSVAKIMEKFESSHQLDHYIVGCKDFMSGRKILGMHIFSNRVWWPEGSDNLFVDPSPKRPGKRIIELKTKPTLVFHMPDPGEFQAFHFGAHRALKVITPKATSSSRNIDDIYAQWSILRGVWKQYRSKRDRRHGLALLGADLAFRGILSDKAANYADDTLMTQFDKFSGISNEELWQVIQPKWNPIIPTAWSYSLGAVGIAEAAALLKKRLVAR